jgi:hypothetical protein
MASGMYAVQKIEKKIMICLSAVAFPILARPITERVMIGHRIFLFHVA